MPIFRYAIILCALLVWTSDTARTQGVGPAGGVACIAPGGSCTSAFRTSNLSSYNYVYASGYYAPSDLGGGLFVRNTSIGNCAVNTLTGTTATASATITINATSLAVGMGVNTTDMNVLPPNDLIVSINASKTQITVANPATGAGTHSFTISQDNGGSIIGDLEPACFSRASSNYGPREWGAKQDTSGQGGTGNDDTASLQNWLNANQPHVGTTGNSRITSPLTCSNPGNFSNYSGVIEGPPPNSPGADSQPSFLITADNTSTAFSNSAMLVMNNTNCAISAAGLIGNPSDTSYDIVDATQKHNSVFNHSLLSGGKIGFHCMSAGADIQILDSSIIKAAADGITSACPNMKITGNVISSNKGNGISISGSQVLIEGNVIEQSGSNGLLCGSPGVQLGVVGNYFDNNGKINPNTSNVRASGCQAVSIVGNQFHRGSPYDEEAGNKTAHVWIKNANDSIAMSGNVYFQGSDTDVAFMRPDYDMELDSSSNLTNFSYSDAPTPQNAVTASNNGIFGPTATAQWGALMRGNLQQNSLAGLTTANVLYGGATTTKLTINPGSAADSTNTQMLSLPASCTVDLTQRGAGGLDTGSGNLHANTQYNFFAFTQAGSPPSAQCIASQGLAPDFVSAGGPSTTVYGFLTGGSLSIANVTPSQCTVLSGNITSCPNPSPFGGLAVGDVITDTSNPSAIQSGTTITALQSVNVGPFNARTNGTQYVALLGGSVPAGMAVGDVVGNCTANSPNQNCMSTPGAALGAFYVIQSIDAAADTYCDAPTNHVPAPCFTMNAPAMGSETAYYIASGGFTITLSNAARSSTVCCNNGPGDTLAVYNDRYRMVAALYTDANDTNIEPFTQDGDTFYLATPVSDINTTLGTTPQVEPLSVPNGIIVEAMGRCVGGTHHVILYTPTTTPGTPAAFPAVPGYDVQAAAIPATGTAFPYRLYTNTSHNIVGLADGSNTTLQCMTDGWVWNRGK